MDETANFKDESSEAKILLVDIVIPNDFSIAIDDRIHATLWRARLACLRRNISKTFALTFQKTDKSVRG